MTQSRTAIVTTNQPWGGEMATAGALRAMQAIRERKIPKEMLRTHPGRKGKIFTYMAHPYATSVLLDSFGMMFSHDVMQFELFDDGTAVALVRLQIHMPIFDQAGKLEQIVTNSITEVGAYSGGIEDKAYCIAAAASRGLCKCLMRRFGLGLELYQTDDTMTPDQAWDALWRYVSNGMKRLTKAQTVEARDQLVALLKEAGIGRASLVDRFEEAYKIASEFLEALQGRKAETPPPMPDEEPKKEAEKPKAVEEPPASHLVDALATPLHMDFPKQGFKKGDPLSVIVVADHAGAKAYKAIEYLAAGVRQGEAPAGTLMRAVQKAAAYIIEHWPEVQEMYHNGHETTQEARREAHDAAVGERMTESEKLPF